MAAKTYRIKQVAELSGVTVRAMHYYDAIGLLCPSQRTGSGYRLYTEADVLLLQQIVVYRELGMPLQTIKAIVGDPTFDRRTALRDQRAQLERRALHTQSMIRALDVALESLEGNEIMNAKELFDGFDPTEHEAEVKDRWGDTDAYRESQRRTKDYTEADWARIKLETEGLLQRIAALMTDGGSPTDRAAMDLAEEHRLQIDRWYYPCSPAMHLGLSQIYMADSRFRETFEAQGDGLAAFLAAAIEANVER